MRRGPHDAMRHRKGEGLTAAIHSLEAPGSVSSLASGAELDKPKSQNTQQELLDRLDILEVLSHWKLELQAKLARKQVVFLYADSSTDFGPLENEVRDFKRVSAMLCWLRRRQP